MNIKEQLNNLTIRKTMNTVEINKSIMELNFKKEQLKNEIDMIQEQIHFLANLRESQRPSEDDEDRIYKLEGKSLFDQMFGGTE